MTISLLAACADFPDLDARVSDNAAAAPYPNFMQTDLLRAQAFKDMPGAKAEQQIMASRLTALKRRIAQARRPVLRASDRRELQNAIARRAP